MKSQILALRRKRNFFLAAVSALLAAGIVGTFILMVRHEPNFYHRAEVAPGTARQKMSMECVGQFVALRNYWDGSQKEWDVTITEAQLNSYLEEDFVERHHLDQVLSKQGITDPRIAIENDKLRIAFRYGSPPWSTIVSYDLKLWLAAKEVNLLCIEFLGRHAGALPIATQSLLNEISEVAGRNGFEVTWYRHEGNPVAMVRIQPKLRSEDDKTDHFQTAARLRRLEVRQGWISIGGVSQEPGLTSNGKHALAPLGN